MHDRTTKGLLFLVLLALVFNAFVMLVTPGRAADEGAQVGRYAIVSYGFFNPGTVASGAGPEFGFYRLDTLTGEVRHESGPHGMN